MRKKIIIKDGEVFGRWTVIKLNVRPDYHLCICDCGISKDVYHYNLIRKKSTSCGCFAKECATKRARHGMAGSAEYQTWNRMWNRCTNPIVERYKNYGGRGIKVCARWLDFALFYKDMGDKPSSKHSIGRIDNDKDYCPENCRWETAEQQRNNTSRTVFIDIDGDNKTLSDISNETGIKADTIRQRVRAGLSKDLVLSKDHLKEAPITVNGTTKLTTAWMRHANIPISSFYHFKRKGLSSEEVITKYLDKAKLKELERL